MITFENMIITPQMAAEMLKNANPNNRNISKKRVAEYADTMKGGEWKNNGECIQFDEDGMLVNGHHRLMAIIIANVPVTMSVLRGIPSATIYDRGRNRNTKDTVTLAGFNLPSKAITAVKLLYYMQNGQKSAGDDKILKYCEKYAQLLREATDIATNGKLSQKISNNASVIVAVFVALRADISPQTLKRFISCLNSGFIDGERESSVIACRNFIIGCRNKSGSVDSKRIVAITLRAIEDFKFGVVRHTYRNFKETEMFKNVAKEDETHFGKNWCV